jgi:hypothetical protein
MIKLILYSLVVGFLTSIYPPAFKRGDSPETKAARKKWGKIFLFFTAFAALYYWMWLPTLMFGWATLAIIFLLVFIGFCWNLKVGFEPVNQGIYWGCLCLFVLSLISPGPMGAAKLLGPVKTIEVSASAIPSDTFRFPIVPQEHARAVGAKVVADALGSEYHVGNYVLQKINGKLYWVAPLDFKSFRSWTLADPAPGVVVVDAQDVRAPARFMEVDGAGKRIKLRYTPGAWFFKNLARHIHDIGLDHFTAASAHLELDDSMNPWWVVTAVNPAAGPFRFGVEGVVVVNPNTGEATGYSVADAPAWIDSVAPTFLTEMNLKSWGESRVGWAAPFVGARPFIEPLSLDGGSAWSMYGADGRRYLYAAMVPHGEPHGSLQSIMLVDSRSGKATECVTGDAQVGSPAAALAAIAPKLETLGDYRATAPLVCAIEGRLAYIVPVIDVSNLVKKVAVVDAQCQIVVLDEDLTTALAEFKKLRGVIGVKKA